MIIDQISVFLENKAGSVGRVTSMLAAAGINIKTFTLEDGSDFGILRMILSDTELGYNILKEAGVNVYKNKVVSVASPDEVGSISKIFKKLADNDISMEYIYAFHDVDTPKVIIRTKDLQRCDEIIG
ncbi:MAG: amino acid-binding protein [Paludibacteraceae bacterium]|nr:amino acid-binding protein [Paludibacteraceae bacterium]